MSLERADQQSGRTGPSTGKDRSLYRFLNAFAGAATIIALGFTIFIYFHDLKYKELRVVLLDSSPLFQNRVDFGQTVSVSVGDKKVDQLWYLKVKYENSGRTPIKKDEIEASTKIFFGQSEALSVSVNEKRPDNLEITINNLRNSLELTHGLMNSGDYAVMDVLASGAKPPTVTCTYRISEIRSCVVIEQISSSKEIYLAGLKVSDNTALLLSSVAFIMAALFSAGIFYIVIQGLIEFSKYLVVRWKSKSLEGAIEALYGPELLQHLYEVKIKELSPWLDDESAAIINDFVNDKSGDTSLGKVMQMSRTQAIRKNISDAVQNAIIALINLKTPRYVPGKKLPSASTARLIDFERDAISYMLKINRNFDAEFVIGIPLFAVFVIIAFVCAGPLRTLLQKWI